jgi:serine/threonine protein kinase
MNHQNRCGACFTSLEGNTSSCPSCGWKEDKKRRNPLALAIGVILHKQYLVGKVLGQGGFGITYLAWDLINHRKIALKEYYPLDIAKRKDSIKVTVSKSEQLELYQYGMQRFNDEANALVRFNRNPGIVAVYDLFEENQTVYMAMQFLEGKTLMEEVEARGGKIPLQEALSIFLPALDAVRAVHEVGMLHRDISPDNLMILPNKQVKLIDFGAARYAMKQHQVYSIIFKPGYTPEEQYRGKGKLGPWSDIYALSATFYLSITGKIPRDAMNRLEEDTLPPPSKLGVQLPKAMEAVIMKALAVKSEGRYLSVEDFKKGIVQSMSAGEGTITNPKTPRWVWLAASAAALDASLMIWMLIMYFN